MRTFIHIGLHKTGTTFIQHLANKNHENLLQMGRIYYDPRDEYPAHHDAAWQLLRGNVDAFNEMASRAKEKNAETLLISSEDLESLLFRPHLAEMLLSQLLQIGVTETVFVVYVRRTDNLFWSIYSELSKHIYVDPIQMLSDILRLGYLFIENPQAQQNAAPFWYFCFDHNRYIKEFKSRILANESMIAKVLVFSYDKFSQYPGDELFEALQAQDMLKNFPSAREQNISLSIEEATKNYVTIFDKSFKSSEFQSHLNFLVENRVYIGPLSRQAISMAIVGKFAEYGAF